MHVYSLRKKRAESFVSCAPKLSCILVITDFAKDFHRVQNILIDACAWRESCEALVAMSSSSVMLMKSSRIILSGSFGLVDGM
eukprot:4760923-Ditylum_brightwellii.AAC.1